jgi:uncharacterized protein (DUF1330 family)
MYDISDYSAYGAYCEKAEPIVKAHGGRYAAVTYNHYNIVSIEGRKPEAVNIAIFPSLEHYMAFYNSKEYHCGNCGPCYMRKNAFIRSNNTDRTIYL